MVSRQRNIPEQDHSIKARSNELFVDDTALNQSPRSTRPFREYLRETPARPLSTAVKALFWVLGIIVSLLFLMAIWRATHQPAGPPRRDVEAGQVSRLP